MVRPLLVLTAACWQGIIEIIIVSVSVWYRKWTQVMSITYPESVHARLFSRATMLRPSWMLLLFCNVQHCQIGCSIYFAYLWSFRWPNYIVTLPRYFSFRLPHLNINTGPLETNWTRIYSESRIFYFSVTETNTVTSGPF